MEDLTNITEVDEWEVHDLGVTPIRRGYYFSSHDLRRGATLAAANARRAKGYAIEVAGAASTAVAKLEGEDRAAFLSAWEGGAGVDELTLALRLREMQEALGEPAVQALVAEALDADAR
ncbi:MAG: hypothetical protein AAGK21_04020 [Bacteroidota bacterium]